MPSAHVEIERAYTQVRADLIRVLQRYQIDPRSGTAISQGLGLNRQLAWQIATIVGETHAPEGLGVMPGNRGLELLVEACRKRLTEVHGAQRSEVEREVLALGQAIEQLEQVVRMHAGDRATLGLMAAAWESNAFERRTEDLRRDAFRAQCALLGAKVETQVRGILFAPSRKGDASKVVMATYQGLRNLTRLREGRSCRLFAAQLPTHDDGSLDKSFPQLEAHIRDRFRLEEGLSTIGADQIEYRVDHPGLRASVILRPGDIGVSAAVTAAFTGVSAYESPRYATRQDQFNQITNLMHVPTETMLIDCWMDRRLPESASFLSSAYAQCFDVSTGLPKLPIVGADPAYLFDLTDRSGLSIESLRADPVLTMTSDLVARAAGRVDTRLEDLIGIRFCMKYVVAPLCVVVSRRLPIDVTEPQRASEAELVGPR
jgi:hypothetical protein